MFFALSKLLKLAWPAQPSISSGAARPGPGITAFFLIGGLASAVLGAWEAATDTDLGGRCAAAGLVVLGVVCMIPATLAISARYDVAWNREGIEGPSRLIAGQILWVDRTRLDWDEVVTFNTTGGGYVYIEAPDRRRIYWSTMTAYSGVLLEAIFHNSPRLVDDQDNDLGNGDDTLAPETRDPGKGKR